MNPPVKNSLYLGFFVAGFLWPIYLYCYLYEKISPVLQIYRYSSQVLPTTGSSNADNRLTMVTIGTNISDNRFKHW